jgi:DNA polymerase/3'-5' exonuclease PolX
VSSGEPRPLAEMAALADEVVELLAPACDRVAVAGSIRRRVPAVRDLELVCSPTLVAYRGGLWGDEPLVEDALALRTAALVADGTFAPRRLGDRAAANGTRYRSLVYRDTPLDLFSPDAETFALVLLIRTGPASFSRRLVTPRSKGGLLPDFMRVKDGRLWSGDRAIPLATEADVFRALGMPVIPPERRTGVERAPLARGGA